MTPIAQRARDARVLLIEDNRGDVVLTQRAFKRASIPNQITVAETGEKGLSILRREGEFADAKLPDIILLDLNLPYMNGREFLDIVKSDPALKRIPVLVLSSSRADNDIVSSYNLHANGYIAKPLGNERYEDIVARVEQFWFNLNLSPDNDN
jgi:CheY-like chemotaxis protein